MIKTNGKEAVVVRTPNMRNNFLGHFRVGDDCWNWTSGLTETGYGIFAVYGLGKIRPHRIAYTLFKGPIPNGLTIDHLCMNRRCVRPDHLEAVTNRENILRGGGPTAVNARKTHCIRGHSDWVATPTYRVCAECRRIGVTIWESVYKKKTTKQAPRICRHVASHTSCQFCGCESLGLQANGRIVRHSVGIGWVKKYPNGSPLKTTICKGSGFLINRPPPATSEGSEGETREKV